jgi:primosomal protein N' (replication factor Y)
MTNNSGNAMKQNSLFADATTPDAGSQRLSVLVPYPVDKAYDYAVPAGLDLRPGDYVCVPLGKREIPGVVWGEGAGDFASAKIKNVVSKYDLPPMPESQRRFLDWMAHYTMNAKGAVLKMALSVPKALERPKPTIGYQLALSPVGRGLGEGQITCDPFKGRATPNHTTQNARELRRDQTDVEKKLWLHLNNRQLHGFKFKRQVPVHPYIADFACAEKKLIIELDGGQHGDQKEYDEKRTEFLRQQGYTVLRFWNYDVLGNFEGVVDTIAQALLCPTPNPLPTGERALAPKHQRVIDILADGLARRPSELSELSGVSRAALKTMAKKGMIRQVEMTTSAPCRTPDIKKEGPKLSSDQGAAADQLKNFVKSGGYHAVLLDGVTGAGKTEVYFEAIAEALKKGQQALILLPEIALSKSFLGRFKSRFGCNPALWHSNLTITQRRTTWRGVAEGECKVIAGARSALFLPYKNLGVIIVDEEHDPAYKQEEGVIYHARDMAVARAHIEKIPIVLVSATPSLETIHNAWNGRYSHLHLPDRFGGARLPDIEIIDMKEDKPERQHFISPTLKKEMIKTLEAGEQVLLFLNRRGYAPLTICRACGHRMECPRCTAWLVEHRASGSLHCHHCAYQTKIPKECPSCNAPGSFAVCGPGVERIHEEVKAAFPDARIMVLASDTADSNDKLRQMLDDIKDRKIDIIIGTQIIAKGHHFPSLTLVGVIDADLGLNGGELRGAERTYQLLHQVAGRAGREEKKGRVYLQTFMPEHKIMKALAAGARDKFLEAEAYEREQSHMPPYARLAGIIVSGRDESEVKYIAKELGKTAPQEKWFQVLGPAPAPFARLRGKYRYRLLVRADKTLDIQKGVGNWLETIKIPSAIRVAVDIDPQSFF